MVFLVYVLTFNIKSEVITYLLVTLTEVKFVPALFRDLHMVRLLAPLIIFKERLHAWVETNEKPT